LDQNFWLFFCIVNNEMQKKNYLLVIWCYIIFSCRFVYTVNKCHCQWGMGEINGNDSEIWDACSFEYIDCSLLDCNIVQPDKSLRLTVFWRNLLSPSSLLVKKWKKQLSPQPLSSPTKHNLEGSKLDTWKSV
jgi:hypothetical protein